MAPNYPQARLPRARLSPERLLMQSPRWSRPSPGCGPSNIPFAPLTHSVYVPIRLDQSRAGHPQSPLISALIGTTASLRWIRA